MDVFVYKGDGCDTFTDISWVDIPSVKGPTRLTPRHASMVFLLKAGKVCVDKKEYVIEEGLAEARDGRVVLFLDLLT